MQVFTNLILLFLISSLILLSSLPKMLFPLFTIFLQVTWLLSSFRTQYSHHLILGTFTYHQSNLVWVISLFCHNNCTQISWVDGTIIHSFCICFFPQMRTYLRIKTMSLTYYQSIPFPHKIFSTYRENSTVDTISNTWVPELCKISFPHSVYLSIHKCILL